jgi:broad specificity phosphatase PhoE
MGKIIYIRHSDDEGGDCSKLQDCQLNQEGRKLAIRTGYKLIKKHGLPNIIYCSPFRRTLQTMENMLRNKDRSGIKIYKETRLSRYFSSSEKLRPNIDPNTMKADIDIHESFEEFKIRIDKFSDSIESLTENNDVIWCITHTTVYKRLSKKYDIKLPKYIPFCHYFILDSNTEDQTLVQKKKKKHRGIWCSNCNMLH